MRPVIYAHGLEGHPKGNKARALRAAGFEVYAPDCRKQPLAERIARIDHCLHLHPHAVLVGSSYGGLASLFLATQRSTMLSGLVLLAPALHLREPPASDPSTLCVPDALSCTVIHGVHDAIVDVQVSQALAVRSPHIRLLEVADSHRLAESHGAMCDAVRAMLL